MPIFHLPAGLAAHSGKQPRVKVRGRTVGEALRSLMALHPALEVHVLDDRGAPKRSVGLFVGEDDVRDLGGLAAPVRDDDVVLVVLAIAGG